MKTVVHLGHYHVVVVVVVIVMCYFIIKRELYYQQQKKYFLSHMNDLSFHYVKEQWQCSKCNQLGLTFQRSRGARAGDPVNVTVLL